MMRVIFAKSATVLLAAVCALGLLPEQTRAQDWSFTISPYFWGAGQEGTAALLPGTPPSEFELSFSEIFDNLDGSAMIAATAQHGDFSISGDIQAIRLKVNGDTPGVPPGGTGLETENMIISLGGNYRVIDSPQAQLWAGAGLRYWRVNNTLRYSDGMGGIIAASGRNSWVDPILGLRGRYSLGERSALVGWAYLGGFGAGSDLMTDLFAGYNYSFTNVTSLSVGWRHLTVDRTDNDFVYDVSQTGPLLGLSFGF